MNTELVLRKQPGMMALHQQHGEVISGPKLQMYTGLAVCSADLMSVEQGGSSHEAYACSLLSIQLLFLCFCCCCRPANTAVKVIPIGIAIGVGVGLEGAGFRLVLETGLEAGDATGAAYGTRSWGKVLQGAKSCYRRCHLLGHNSNACVPLSLLEMHMLRGTCTTASHMKTVCADSAKMQSA